jgi:arylsulfatase A-like enzyme
MNLIRVLIRILGSFVLVGLVLAIVAGLFLGLRVLTYVSAEDGEHLAAKTEYLEGLRVAQSSSGNETQRPNILIILFDDLGYGDLSVYGAQSIATPNIDALAKAGLRLTNYYAPSPVCTSSRAAMLTGRYAPRANLNIVAFPTGDPLDLALRAQNVPATQIPPEEILLPEILSAAGYDTGMVGKWHMGDRAPSRPMDRGFDSYVGALYSNDMTPFAIYRGNEVEHEAPFDQTRMKEVYEEAAVEFLEVDRDAPFFFYFAPNFPHIPLYTPESDHGRSGAGLYGDVVEGLDDSVGRLLDVLERRGQLENTLIILTSDNGPWYEGSPGFVRGRKNQTWEGGMRVPFIAHWPGVIAPGRESDAAVVGVDLVPTLLSLLGIPIPTDRMIDGIDQGPHLIDGEAPPDRLVHYFGVGGQLDAIRDARFKYHRRRGVRGVGTENLSFNLPQGPWLFDLSQDPNESYDASRRYPEEVERMAALFAEKIAETDVNPRGWQ